MAEQKKSPRRFAPLDPGTTGGGSGSGSGSGSGGAEVPGLKGIVFDVDGTLW